MTDIKALVLLTQQIKVFQTLPQPPTSFDGAKGYKITLEKALQGGQREVVKVKTYVEEINEKLQQLSKEIQTIIKQNQDAIKKIFDAFKPAALAVSSQKYLQQLQLARELQEVAKKLMNDRLNDLINGTDEVCAKIKDGVALTLADFDNLHGCLDSWKNAKAESFKEEQRKKEEEKRRKQEDARQRNEEQERSRKELQEKKRKEEEERKIREKEERMRKEEEEKMKKAEEARRRREEAERRKKEEEERKQKEEERKKHEQEEAERRAKEDRRKQDEKKRLRKDEELRRQQQIEERKRREEEERKKRKEEERKRMAEEEERRREEERQIREAERREQERLKKEAEERAFRQDPNHWKPIVYTRNDDGEADGRRAFHEGISCILTSPPGGITEEDLQCVASDELDHVIEMMDDEEKPVSSLIDMKSMKDSLHSELQRDWRTYIAFTEVRFPYYLTSLSSYVSHVVCKKDKNFGEQFLISLLGKVELHSEYHPGKHIPNNAFPEQMCKAILLHWMKRQATHNDKILSVMKALERIRLYKIAEDCHNFVQYHKEHMTDEALKELASGTTKDTKTLGAELELDEKEISRCIRKHSNDELERKVALLMAWRESDMVVKYGDKALDHLKEICV